MPSESSITCSENRRERLPGSALHFDAAQTRRYFRLSEAGDPEREPLQQLISRSFERCHEASISRFMPLMVSAWKGFAPEAVAGIESASDNRLFTETYLDHPAEQDITRLAGVPVNRNQIVEIGNLASNDSQACKELFVILAELLYRAGFQWLICTVTPIVERQLRMMNFYPQLLGYADGKRLGKQTADWGHYYDCKPRIIAGSLATAFEHLHSTSQYRNIVEHHQGDLDAMVSRRHFKADQ